MKGSQPWFRQRVAALDDAVDARFAPLRANAAANRLFYAASEAGNFSAIWHALAWAPVLGRPTPANLRRAVTVSAALGAESAIVNGAVKSLFRRTRPPANAAERPHRLRTPKTSSFPSGHASAAMVGASMLSRGRPSGPLYYAVGLIVAASRVHVRMHHASDVAAGLVVGWVLGRAFRRLLP